MILVLGDFVYLFTCYGFGFVVWMVLQRLVLG